ncbi:MAG TPA: DUF72 domain-containing protein [Candidatus Limnocylindria bacterium]|jgi:uncharacterized protein YecE (DUF72 family)|nr:DUF72 domain-containing protein [Candidatus Limnocylindria bacterium]
MARAEIRIGCSGWQYRHWRGRFYPRELPTDEWLDHYVRTFDTVELNNSFYRLPEADTFAAWGRRVPPGFLFAVKASRYLTHLKRLREPREPLDRLWSRATRLGDHLGPMLYQLPPRWDRNLDRLRDFVAQLPKGRLQAIEFRDRSWYTPETSDMLRSAGVALCLHDMPRSETRAEPIGPFVYVRFHGAAGKYRGGYPPQALTAWARRLRDWAIDGLPAYVYFNNDIGGHAPRDAEKLRELVGR